MAHKLQMFIYPELAHMWTVVEPGANGDPLDIICTNCQGKSHVLQMELIQYGFDDDVHTYFTTCQDCLQQHAIRLSMPLTED